MTDKTGALRTRTAETQTTWQCLTCHFEVVDTVLPRKCPGVVPHASSSSRLALRLRTKPKLGSRLLVAGLVALALLALGEQAPGAFPVHVSVEGHAASGQLQVDVDGATHTVSSVLGGNWQRLVLEPARTRRSRIPDRRQRHHLDERSRRAAHRQLAEHAAVSARRVLARRSQL